MYVIFFKNNIKKFTKIHTFCNQLNYNPAGVFIFNFYLFK